MSRAYIPRLSLVSSVFTIIPPRARRHATRLGMASARFPYCIIPASTWDQVYVDSNWLVPIAPPEDSERGQLGKSESDDSETSETVEYSFDDSDAARRSSAVADALISGALRAAVFRSAELRRHAHSIAWREVGVYVTLRFPVRADILNIGATHTPTLALVRDPAEEATARWTLQQFCLHAVQEWVSPVFIARLMEAARLVMRFIDETIEAAVVHWRAWCPSSGSSIAAATITCARPRSLHALWAAGKATAAITAPSPPEHSDSRIPWKDPRFLGSNHAARRLASLLLRFECQLACAHRAWVTTACFTSRYVGRIAILQGWNRCARYIRTRVNPSFRDSTAAALRAAVLPSSYAEPGTPARAPASARELADLLRGAVGCPGSPATSTAEF